MHNQSQHRRVIIRLARLLVGVLVIIVSSQWDNALTSQIGWFPFLVALSMLTAWVAGPPWGWAVTVGYIVVGGAFDIARAIQGSLDWYYHGDLVAAVLSQGETLTLTGIFALVASAASLFAWGSADLLRHLIQHGHVQYRQPPG